MPLNNNTEKTKEPETMKKSGWKKKLLSLITILLVIAVTICLFLYRDKVSELGNYGYLGSFLISLVSCASIILPVPGLLIIIGLGASFNPYLLALAGGFGGALGEMTGYILGISGRGFTSNNKWYLRAEQWMRKRGFLAVFAFAFVPFLPMDVAGLLAGILRYPIWKFLLACTLGKTLKYIILILAGVWGWEWLLNYLS
jgi:membrane protein YqaA with SNARE-associated domain